MTFHWRAKALEAKGASPVPDGLPLQVLGMDLDEIMPGRGDGLTAEKLLPVCTRHGIMR